MKKIMLCILDGIGVTNRKKGNAFYKAKTPNIDMLLHNFPNTLLDASGTSVGLPKGQMGNSEVGHMTIGAGKVIFQSLEYINRKITNNEFKNNEVFLKTIDHTKKNNSTLHLIGLLSDGGVHSNITHLFSLLELCKEQELKKVNIHIITDGRDTAVDSSLKYIKMLNEKIDELNIGKIVSISGRYYAMDRDNRYERLEKYYNCIVNGENYSSSLMQEIIQESYKSNKTDEFIEPVLLDKEGVIKEDDGIIVYNFRPDRLREILFALTNNEKVTFNTKKINNLSIATMMHVNDELNIDYAFSIEEINNPLGVILDNNNKSQLRIAETEKYAHVTYFFDGGKELDLKLSKRILVPSPKVATYDLKPEMSAYKINRELMKELKTNKYDLIVLNYANGDMVGHTGKLDKAILAVEAVDDALGKIYAKYKDKYTFIITADHGNCEVMLNEDNTVNTAHTNNQVFCVVTDKSLCLEKGSLSDIAPTILDLMDIKKSEEMTGKSLIKKDELKEMLESFDINSSVSKLETRTSFKYILTDVDYKKLKSLKENIALCLKVDTKNLMIYQIDNNLVEIVKFKNDVLPLKYKDVIGKFKKDNCFKLPIGLDHEDNLVSINLDNKHNLLVTGVSGIGKTNLFNNLILSILKYYPDKVITIMDVQGINYNNYLNRCNVLNSKESIIANINAIYNNIEVNNDKDFVIFIDELYDLLDIDNTLVNKINYLLDNSDKFNINFIICNDTIENENVAKIFRNPNAYKISFYLSSQKEYKAFIKKEVDISLGNDAIYKDNNELVRISIPLIDEFEEWLK